MKYYYVTKHYLFDYEKFGTSMLLVSPQNEGLNYESEYFWDYPKKIKLYVRAEDGADKLYFRKYVQNKTYVISMIPELKEVLEKFNMPEHRWYEAEAGYSLKFVKDMKDFFNIDYDIDINEKRPYWVLQFLGVRYMLQQLDFPNISFDLIDAKNYGSIKVGVAEKGIVKNFEEYALFNEEAYKKGTQALKITKYIYRRNYDILWGGSYIIFNEKVKEALEATNIITAENGLEFVEFTDYEIEMLGE